MEKLNTMMQYYNLHPNTMQGILDKNPKHKNLLPKPALKELKRIIQLMTGGRTY